MSGKASHEAATSLQYRRSVVLRGCFDVWQREPNRRDDLERVRRLLICQPSLHRSRLSAFARRDSTRSDIGKRQGARSLAIDVCEAVLHRKARGHEHGSGVPHDVGIPGKRRDGTSDELGGF